MKQILALATIVLACTYSNAQDKMHTWYDTTFKGTPHIHKDTFTYTMMYGEACYFFPVIDIDECPDCKPMPIWDTIPTTQILYRNYRNSTVRVAAAENWREYPTYTRKVHVRWMHWLWPWPLQYSYFSGHDTRRRLRHYRRHCCDICVGSAQIHPNYSDQPRIP